uniref:Uncharacterized protein n=1 Tax=Picea sitchensis TaxID=3332 RepID=A0A6B9XXT3_PICSI|nr:hypothetical protein Q903MT_gene5441 [Picea sitchensis]
MKQPEWNSFIYSMLLMEPDASIDSFRSAPISMLFKLLLK